MAGFLDHLLAEIQALERALAGDPRFIKLRELQRVRALYETQPVVDSLLPREAGQHSSRRAGRREMSPATRLVVEAARDFLTGRGVPVPLRDLLHEISEVRGVPIGGSDPINNLSAMLYRYGFEAVGRTGWRVRKQAAESDSGTEESEDGEPEKGNIFGTPKPNGAPHEIHGAATL